MKSKKDIILVVVTVILVIVLIVGFIYDRNSALLQRTNLYDVSRDDNLEVVKMNKVGFLYARAAYEAMLKIKDGDKDNLYNAKYDVFENRGGDRYNFAFADGKNTFNAQYGVNILRYNGDFHIKIVSTFTWTYKKDAEVDHENKGKVDPSTWTSSYVRKRGREMKSSR